MVSRYNMRKIDVLATLTVCLVYLRAAATQSNQTCISNYKMLKDSLLNINSGNRERLLYAFNNPNLETPHYVWVYYYQNQSNEWASIIECPDWKNLNRCEDADVYLWTDSPLLRDFDILLLEALTLDFLHMPYLEDSSCIELVTGPFCPSVDESLLLGLLTSWLKSYSVHDEESRRDYVLYCQKKITVETKFDKYVTISDIFIIVGAFFFLVSLFSKALSEKRHLKSVEEKEHEKKAEQEEEKEQSNEDMIIVYSPKTARTDITIGVIREKKIKDLCPKDSSKLNSFDEIVILLISFAVILHIISLSLIAIPDTVEFCKPHIAKIIRIYAHGRIVFAFMILSYISSFSFFFVLFFFSCRKFCFFIKNYCTPKKTTEEDQLPEQTDKADQPHKQSESQLNLESCTQIKVQTGPSETTPLLTKIKSQISSLSSVTSSVEYPRKVNGALLAAFLFTICPFLYIANRFYLLALVVSAYPFEAGFVILVLISGALPVTLFIWMFVHSICTGYYTWILRQQSVKFDKSALETLIRFGPYASLTLMFCGYFYSYFNLFIKSDAHLNDPVKGLITTLIPSSFGVTLHYLIQKERKKSDESKEASMPEDLPNLLFSNSSHIKTILPSKYQSEDSVERETTHPDTIMELEDLQNTEGADSTVVSSETTM